MCCSFLFSAQYCCKSLALSFSRARQICLFKPHERVEQRWYLVGRDHLLCFFVVIYIYIPRNACMFEHSTTNLGFYTLDRAAPTSASSWPLLLQSVSAVLCASKRLLLLRPPFFLAMRCMRCMRGVCYIDVRVASAHYHVLLACIRFPRQQLILRFSYVKRGIC